MSESAETELTLIDAKAWARIVDRIKKTDALTSEFGLRGLQPTERLVAAARYSAWDEISALVIGANVRPLSKT